MTTMPIDMDKAKAMSKDDPLYLIDVDHVRFNVGNAKQAAYFYSRCFGFNISQVSDLTTGCLLYTSPSPRDVEESRMPSSA